ncbi:hypothetical protein TRFO_09286 [Tritrichomonas foetus]|uniref:Uncharacterized protein n=1 Tax=Tritrichomonas foetus TaxID=1144522 RepID=A0A1J4JJZ1_9EUKA|nr:hypothetical protein TRFO_09286 [Tritrichomonas foetus]|eukprot:OHS97843.1 hypothetical protein TRFO_09286 [Tritrichomonas foetus]
MMAETDLREMRKLLVDTQFTYSEVCLSYAKLVGKKWYHPEKEIIIPSVANESEIQEIVRKAELMDVEIPHDDDENSEYDDYNHNQNMEFEVDSPPIVKDQQARIIPSMKSVFPKTRKILAGKRISIPWTKAETDAVINGIKKFGVGKWAKIRDTYSDIFAENGRTSRDIYDKYKGLRQTKKYAKVLKDCMKKS